MPEALPAPRAARFGVSAALVTPFAADGAIDPARAGDHAARLLSEGCDSVTLFGTTGEGASLGLRERAALHDGLLAAGVAPERIVCALAATALETAVDQARAALERGARRLLATPPFYFRGPADDGLFAWYAALIAALGGAGPRLILYHIPQVTGVPLSLALIRRLRDAFGPAILGVKDSSGDWATSRALLDEPDLAVLIGDERLLARAAPLGGAGAISGMANLFPALLARIVAGGAEPAGLAALVDAVCAHPVVPAVKALVAHHRGDPAWARVRAPLLPAPAPVAAALAARLDALSAA